MSEPIKVGAAGMSRGHYILEGHTPVACDLLTWAKWFERREGRVAKTDKDGVTVSTMFLGLDHQYGDGPPLLFETMIFGGEHNDYQERCSTWDEAEKMHADACKVAFGEQP